METYEYAELEDYRPRCWYLNGIEVFGSGKWGRIQVLNFLGKSGWMCCEANLEIDRYLLMRKTPSANKD